MRIPDLFAAFRRASRDARRDIAARSGLQLLAVGLVLAIAAANVVLFFTATPRPQAHAASGTFSETFATTTYRDAANTTGSWLGNGTAYMGFGSASSTRVYMEVAPAGNKGFSGVSCKDASTCYLTTNAAMGSTVLRSTDAGANWEQVYGSELADAYTNLGTAFKDVYAVPGTDVVYAVGKDSNNGGLVIKSTDGGTTWAFAKTGFSGTVDLLSISCSDASTCVAVGDNLADVPKVYMTSDGGTTWTAGTVPVGGHALRGVNFINDGTSSTWRAVGVSGWTIVSMATTTPQGWTAEAADTLEELRAVAMPVYGTVIIVGGTLQATSFVAQSTNDGVTYAEVVDAMTTYLWDVVCGSTTTCWAVSYHGIERSTDAGATWSSVTSNVWYLLSATAVSGSVAYVAGDGNTTFTLMKTSTSSDFTDINVNPLCDAPQYPGYCGSTIFPVRNLWLDPSDGQTSYAVGDNGSTGYVAKSTDAGQTWAFATSNNPGRINAIDCATSQVCFGAGISGALFKTTDGAANWTTQTQSSVFNANAVAVDAVTSQMAWVVGTNGSAGKAKIVRTIDGGTTYTAATGTISSAFWAEDVWADSTTTAWVAGYDTGTGNDGIYYTADGGASWTQQYNVAGSILYDIFFLPGNNIGWALDAAGPVLKTTNAGGTWTQVATVGSGPIGQYSEVNFLNASVGFISGDACSGATSKFLTTVDGGTHWTMRTVPCMQGPMSFYGNTGVIGSGSSITNAQLGRLVFPYGSSSVLKSTTIDSTSSNISCAGITRTQTLNGGAVTYEMSNDGGATWTNAAGTCNDDAGHTITADVHFVFASTGSDLRWRATLTGSGSPPTASPSIDTLSVTYISNALPATPTNSAPADAAVNQSLTPTLSASAFSDADGDDTQGAARWEVSTTSGDYTSPVYATTSTDNLTSIPVPSGTLANGTTYYWHVQYSDYSGGYSAFSTETSFVTNNLPNTPTNVSPANGATGVSLTPTLTSSAFSDADAGDTHASSRWEVSSVAGNFSAPIYASTSSINLTSLVIPSGALANNTTYYWHVKYVDASGNNSAFSTATSFTTLAQGGSSQSSIAKSSVPNSPVADGGKTERGAKKILWKFQDMSGTELGFSIVDAKDQTKEYVTSKPTFTQDLSELLETGATPATEHCNRAVVAFNDKGNSPITAASIYPCTWTVPATPGTLKVATSTQTTILIDGIAPDDNPNTVTYSICDVKTKLCLARGSVAALAIAAIPTPTDNPADAGFVLSKTGDKLTKAEWGSAILVAGLMPNTPYAFVATAYSPNGESASGQVASGGGGTQQASVQFVVDKSVAVYPLQPAQAALAGIGFAADFSFGVLALLAIGGVAAYLLLHRKSGSIRCVAGLMRIWQHHTRSYMAVVGNGVGGPALTRHARIHRFTQTAMLSALGALAVKGAIVGAVLLGPSAAFGQGDFSGDGSPVMAGDTLFYQISVKNIGPGNASSVVLTDALPQGTLFKVGTLTENGIARTDACDNDGVCVSKNVLTYKPSGGLKVDQAAIITVAVKVFGAAGQIITNTACVTSQELPTPTCAAKTANPIVAAKPPIEAPVNENLNANANENANVNAPTPEKVTPPANRNVNAPTNVNQNRNANVNENANANVNAPPPPPPLQPGESQITIDGAPPSPERPTGDATPEIAGRGTPGALVTISVDGTLVGVAFVEADGTWRFRLRDPLPEGVHLVAASDAGKLLDTATFTTDTVAPPTIANLGILLTKVSLSIRTEILPGESRGQDTTLVISGHTGGDTALVHLRIQSDPIEVTFAPPAADWTREVTGRFDPGTHTVTAVALDAAGNSSESVTRSFVIPEPEALAAPLAVLDNPRVEAAAAVVAPAVVAAAAANVALATGIPALLNFLGLLFTQPALLFARREKKGYGVVFNSLSKLPVDLAIVRVRAQDSQRILQTKVTDRLGRYALFLAPGAFAVEVTKQGFTHPTAYLAGKTEDVAYTDLLTAPAVALTEPGRIAKNIPLDPLEDTKTPAAILRKVFLRRLQYAFALAGPIVSVVTLIITPTLLILGLTVLQFLAFALFRRLAYKKPPKSWGIVRDEQTGKPIPNAIVRIFETTYNKLLETQITDGRGRYAFLVGQNRYYVVVSAPGYAETRTMPLDFSAAEKGAVVAKDVALKR